LQTCVLFLLRSFYYLIPPFFPPSLPPSLPPSFPPSWTTHLAELHENVEESEAVRAPQHVQLGSVTAENSEKGEEAKGHTINSSHALWVDGFDTVFPRYCPFDTQMAYNGRQQRTLKGERRDAGQGADRSEGGMGGGREGGREKGREKGREGEREGGRNILPVPIPLHICHPNIEFRLLLGR
jgi:hypothetical protein